MGEACLPFLGDPLLVSMVSLETTDGGGGLMGPGTDSLAPGELPLPRRLSSCKTTWTAAWS